MPFSLEDIDLDMAFSIAWMNITPGMKHIYQLSIHALHLFKNILFAQTTKYVQTMLKTYPLKQWDEILFIYLRVAFQIAPRIAEMFKTHFMNDASFVKCNDECVICLESCCISSLEAEPTTTINEENDPDKTTTFPCRHSYHIECVSEWFMNRVKYYHNTDDTHVLRSLFWSCPMCRQHIIKNSQQS
jgi:hypothetical protein